MTDSLYLGYNTGASGTYTLSGTGSLSSGSEYVGYNGSGSFTQSGGTNSVTDTLALGYGSGRGTYNLTGGSLSVTVSRTLATPVAAPSPRAAAPILCPAHSTWAIAPAAPALIP